MNRTEWKALHHDLRALARANPRVESHAEWFTHLGLPWILVRRLDARTMRPVTIVEPRVIRDRSPIYRAALELAWARYFKARRKLQAARDCVADARAILQARSAFHALP